MPELNKSTIVQIFHGMDASMPNNLDDELYTRDEAAEYLGVSKRALTEWAHRGTYDLKYIKVGRCTKYRKKDLDALIAFKMRQLSKEGPSRKRGEHILFPSGPMSNHLTSVFT